MSDDLAPLAREILNKVIYMTIATASKDGVPWNSIVFFANDQEYNFYWTSSPRTQHSKNIYENDRVFILVFDPTAREGTGYGVYLSGRAKEVTDKDEIKLASDLMYARKNMPSKGIADFIDNAPRRIYKATPETFWINSDKKVDGHHVDTRTEVNMSR